jgi:hypothetical protein
MSNIHQFQMRFTITDRSRRTLTSFEATSCQDLEEQLQTIWPSSRERGSFLGPETSASCAKYRLHREVLSNHDENN